MNEFWEKTTGKETHLSMEERAQKVGNSLKKLEKAGNNITIGRWKQYQPKIEQNEENYT